MEVNTESQNIFEDDYFSPTPPHGIEAGFGIYVWYITVACMTFVGIMIIVSVVKMMQLGQKTRNPQQRRTYMGSRQRPSLTQSEPTIYVSPANLPPPPKYEAMAPPSYEEVVGIHYPQYQSQIQPITQPITSALAESSNATTNTVNTVTSVRSNENMPVTVVTVAAS